MKISKFNTQEFRNTLVKIATHDLRCGDGAQYPFTSYRTPDNQHFFLLPRAENPYIIRFGANLKAYEVDYILLGLLGMTK